MTQCLDQASLETLYSQRNVHWILQSAIDQEMDEALLDWNLQAHIKLPQWLDEMLSTTYDSKKQRLTLLKSKIAVNGLQDLLIATAAAIVLEPKQTYQQAIGYLQSWMPHDDPFERAQTAAEVLAVLASKKDQGLYWIRKRGSGNHTQVIRNRKLDIEQAFGFAQSWINDTQFNLPLVVRPMPVKNNRSAGYYTLREPVILGSKTMHDLPQNLEALNTLNQMEWVIDSHVLAEQEMPSRPLDTVKKQEQFNQHLKDCAFVYDLFKDRVHWRIWQYDCRGRMYDHGHHIHFQSYAYKKALLSFNRWEYLH